MVTSRAKYNAQPVWYNDAETINKVKTVIITINIISSHSLRDIPSIGNFLAHSRIPYSQHLYLKFSNSVRTCLGSNLEFQYCIGVY